MMSSEQHDPFPMRSEEARRLAASVEQSNSTTKTDDHDNVDGDTTTINNTNNNNVGVDGGGPTWHKMSMTISQRLPKFLKMAGRSGRSRSNSRRSNEGGNSSRESLVAKKKKKKKQNMKKTVGANDEEESIYDRDDLDESRGIHNNDNNDEDDDDNYNNNYEDDDDDDEEEDDYIETPSIRSRANRMLLRPQDVSDLPYPVGILLLKIQHYYFTIRSMAKSIHRHLYGDTWSWDDMIRTMVLSSTLFVMIGGYWLLRSLKDVVMTALCGVESIPKAKMLSVFVVLGIVAIYNHLLDSTYRKEQLFYIFGSFYLLLFTSIAILLDHPTIGLANQMSNPNRVLGWVSYCGIESFGSVMVALFWSYANSSFNLKQAKRSYGVMVATAQLGSILGPSFVKTFGQKWGIPSCYMAGASCMLMLQFTMWVYVTMFGVSPEDATSIATNKDATAAVKDSSVMEKKKPKAGILEGIHLFVSHNYVKGIFAISCLYEIEVTIVDYTMKVLASDYYASEHPCTPYHESTGEAMTCWNFDTNMAAGMSTDAAESFTSFMGLFGQATNTLSFILSFFGTSAIIRYLGLRTTLLLFPSICLLVIVAVRLYPTLNVVFAAMMILKANSYALNNPTKEMLYQPTSTSVKYKAKSWIDIFGMRGSKALGSVVTNAFASSIAELVDKGSVVGIGVAGFLIWNARYMGRKFDEYTNAGYIVGEANDDEDVEEDGVVGGDHNNDSNVGGRGRCKGSEMASRQNDAEETSCATFYDDDEIGIDEEGQSETKAGDNTETSISQKMRDSHHSESAVVEMV